MTVSTKNPIATVLSFPDDLLDGRWHIVTIGGKEFECGKEFEYTAASGSTAEGIYRHNAGIGVSNACFSVRPGNQDPAASVAKYLSRWGIEGSVTVTDHRPHR